MYGTASCVFNADIDGQAMLASIVHRGPDAFGGFRATVAGRQVILGHARLSIIGLSAAGHQPMFADGERIALVHNGEIFNFQKLRGWHLRGVTAQSRADTEVALLVYERLGINFVHSFSGSSATSLAVFESDQEQVVCFLRPCFPDGVEPFECVEQFEFDDVPQRRLSYLDRVPKANSVEAGVLGVDHCVAEFAYSRPTSFTLGRAGQLKHVLVDVFAGSLPEYFVRRCKSGFGLHVNSLVNEESIANPGESDLENMRALIALNVEGAEDDSTIIYAPISGQHWDSKLFDAGRAGGDARP